MEGKAKYLFYPMIAACIWGGIYIFSGVALKAMSSPEVAFYRLAASVPFIWAVMKARGLSFKIKKEHIKFIWLIGFLGYFCCINATTLAIQFSGSVLGSLLVATTPVGIMVAGYFILKEKVSLRQWLMIAVALGGVVVVSAGDISGGSILGGVFAFLSVSNWGIASCLMRKISKGYPPFVITFWSIIASLVFYIPVCGVITISRGSFPTFEGETIFAIVFMATIGTAVAQSLWTAGLAKLPAAVCSMFYPLQPISAAIMGILLYDEPITKRFVIGGIIITFAIVGALLPSEKLIKLRKKIFKR